MGTLIRVWNTVPMPEGATVGRNGAVTWTVKGKKRTGKLSKSGKVNVQVDTWTAQYTDEVGTVRRVSTKTTNRSAAEKILARYEAEIDRLKAGVVTREELEKVQVKKVPFDEALEKFRTKMVAGGNTPKHINLTLQRVSHFFHVTGTSRLALRSLPYSPVTTLPPSVLTICCASARCILRLPTCRVPVKATILPVNMPFGVLPPVSSENIFMVMSFLLAMG